jgi:hypothetical protein
MRHGLERDVAPPRRALRHVPEEATFVGAHVHAVAVLREQEAEEQLEVVVVDALAVDRKALAPGIVPQVSSRQAKPHRAAQSSAPPLGGSPALEDLLPEMNDQQWRIASAEVAT